MPISFDNYYVFKMSKTNGFGSRAFSNCIGYFQLGEISIVSMDSGDQNENVCLEMIRFSCQAENSDLAKLLVVLLLFSLNTD